MSRARCRPLGATGVAARPSDEALGSPLLQVLRRLPEPLRQFLQRRFLVHRRVPPLLSDHPLGRIGAMGARNRCFRLPQIENPCETTAAKQVAPGVTLRRDPRRVAGWTFRPLRATLDICAQALQCLPCDQRAPDRLARIAAQARRTGVIDMPGRRDPAHLRNSSQHVASESGVGTSSAPSYP